MDLFTLALTIVVVLIIAAMLVNLVAVNILRQAAYYREWPAGDYDENRRQITARARQRRKDRK